RRCRASISRTSASSSCRRPACSMHRLAMKKARADAMASTAPWTATVLTIFPEMFPGPLAHSLAGQALAPQIWQIGPVDIRDFAQGRHRTVDDAPFGGGPGMVMRPDVIDRALNETPAVGPTICLSPRGPRLAQARIAALAAGPGVRLLCGRFEGIDQ